MKPKNESIIANIEESIKGLGLGLHNTTHYRSPDGYVSYGTRLGTGYRGAALCLIASPNPQFEGTRYAVVLQDWSDSSSGMKTIDSHEIFDPTPENIRAAIIAIISPLT